MQIIRLLFICFLATPLFGQEVITFENEIDVSDGSIYGNIRPRMALSNGVPLILYGRSGGGLLFVSRWNGSGFDAPVSLLPAGVETYLASWTGPDIAAKGDTIIVVFKAQPLETGNVYSVRSTDGGLTFSDTIRVDNHDLGVAWMPSLDISSDGNPVVTYMAHDPTWVNPRFVLASSDDTGLTYNPEVEVTGSIPGEACDCCPAEVVIDGLKQVMLFRNNETNLRDIYGVLSLDGGMNYPYNTDVDNTMWMVNSCPSTGPSGTFVGNDLYTTFASRASGEYRIYVTRSSAATDLVFAARDTVIESNFNTSSQNYPRIHSSGDTVVLAWQENKGSDADIYVSIATGLSNDHLISLTDYPTLGNETTTNSQTTPDIRIENGIVHLCYQDLSSGNIIYRRGMIGGIWGQEEHVYVDLNISPNPSKDGVFIIEELTDLQDLKVFDANGREVNASVTAYNSGVKVHILQPMNGLYYITGISPSGEKVFSKLVVQQ